MRSSFPLVEPPVWSFVSLGSCDCHFAVDLAAAQLLDFAQVAGWIADIIDAGGTPDAIARVREQVTALCKRFPVYHK